MFKTKEEEIERTAQAAALHIHIDCLESLLTDPKFEIPEDTQTALACQTKTPVCLWETDGTQRRLNQRGFALALWWPEERDMQTMTPGGRLLLKRIELLETQLAVITSRLKELTNDRR